MEKKSPGEDVRVNRLILSFVKYFGWASAAARVADRSGPPLEASESRLKLLFRPCSPFSLATSSNQFRGARQAERAEGVHQMAAAGIFFIFDDSKQIVHHRGLSHQPFHFLQLVQYIEGKFPGLR